MNIPPVSISSVYRASEPQSVPKPASANLQSVTRTFEEMLNSLNESQLKADDLVQKLALGENVDLHTVMIGLEENDVNFRVALAIRDKLVEAYHEIMRMQV